MGNLECNRVRLSGTVAIALSVERAFGLFTPSGERIWAHGWDPLFPSPGAEETEPGTVFLTTHGGRESTWTVVHCERGRSIAYAVVTPQERAGIVAVTCDPSGTGTRAMVSYDMTALCSRANTALARFAENYAAFLAHWEHCIAEAVQVDPGG